MFLEMRYLRSRDSQPFRMPQQFNVGDHVRVQQWFCPVRITHIDGPATVYEGFVGMEGKIVAYDIAKRLYTLDTSPPRAFCAEQLELLPRKNPPRASRP